MPEQSRVDVLHCHECGESRRIESTGQPPRCVPASQPGGFMIDHVEVLVTGRCPSCVTGRSAAPVAGRSAAPVAEAG